MIAWENRLRAILVGAVLTVLAGCAADGGSTGTGISAVVSGNVSAVEDATGDMAGVSDLRVSIDELPGVEDTTDDAGSFELSGEFAGAFTLRFSTPDRSVTQPIDVPAGSVVVLENIAIGRRDVRVSVARQLGFFGTVALTDCTAGDLLVDDRGASPRQFLVRITEETIIVGGDGEPLACGEIVAGDAIAVEGAIRLSDRTIEAATLTIEPGRPGEPSPLIEIRFQGRLNLINCEAGMMMIASRTGPARLRLSAQSALLDSREQPIECAALAVGDVVQGRGTIRVRRPGVIDVIEMHTTRAGA